VKNNDSKDGGPRPAGGGVPRTRGEVFCIHSYAGEAGPPCGWRGRWDEILRDAVTGVRRCPRCGRVTLIDLPARDPRTP
jgi:hypothetical protein